MIIPEAPTAGWRITITSGSYAESVWTVSRSDSPLSTLDPAAFRLMVSADSRLAASSNDELVRVDASKKTVITVRPRRVGTFFMSRCITLSKPSGGLQDPVDVGPAQVGDRDQVPPLAAALGGMWIHSRSSQGWMRTTRSISSTSTSSTLTRSERAVGRFLPT